MRVFFAPWISNKNFAIFFQPFDHHSMFSHSLFLFYFILFLKCEYTIFRHKTTCSEWSEITQNILKHTVCISKFNFYFHSLVRLRKTNCMKLYPCISVCRICTKQTVTSKWLFKRFYIFEVISGHRPLIQRIFIPEFQY